MLTVFKIAATSAVLAAGVVTWLDRGPAPVSAARFLVEQQEAKVARPTAPAAPLPAPSSCLGTWPYVDQSCLDQDASRRSVRTIELDRRPIAPVATSQRADYVGSLIR
ncbi:MAG: hypothetical protein JO048_11495 [Methylobacteriaceae bacterium]|nr:hypothetical protein [Methylobacteriaceae bacterium]